MGAVLFVVVGWVGYAVMAMGMLRVPGKENPQKNYWSLESDDVRCLPLTYLLTYHNVRYGECMYLLHSCVGQVPLSTCTYTTCRTASMPVWMDGGKSRLP
ncbi:hypothetical protein F5Y14DRAFT_99467 [Nemania sp. NC0429]|nr:hypothetical protein F5Y14DRAFT_99467 [Nemania sp. NC0429]